MSVKISKFNAGGSRRADNYDYFLPADVNHQFDVDMPRLQTQLEESARKLGELNAMAKLVPDVRLFIQSFINSEAIFSSRIEGTQTSTEDAFIKKEENIRPERRNDWLEVRLYINALEEAINALSSLPLCNRLIKQMHKTLLSSGRGKNKMPGEFRTSQNWLGGTSPQNANFVPPHQRHVADLMGDLEKLLSDDAHAMPELVRIGIAHYQFETIHPFLDGNGRVGRMLIVVFLVEHQLLEKALLYPSAFFERHKEVYYQKLTRVRTENDLGGWLLFFLEGVKEVAQFSIDTLQGILELKELATNKIRENSGRRADNIVRALDYAFQSPVFTSRELSDALCISPATANKTIAAMRELKLLAKPVDVKRHRSFIFSPYLDILRREFGD